MIRSMTGYSRVQREEEGLVLTVSIKTVNHRFFDPQVRLPGALDPLEPLLRRLLKNHVTRGRVEITVSLERPGALELKLDRKLLEAYKAAYQELQQEFKGSAPLDLMALLRVPGIVASNNGEIPPAELERIGQVLERVTGETLARLDEMRVREGEALERDLRARLARLGELCEVVGKLAQKVPGAYERRLETRVRELLASVDLDRGRLAQEVAYLASRSDITEELTRFQSHLQQALRLMEESPEVGKKLDFLLQEMNREANTLLSKTTDVPEVGLEVTRLAIEMKTEIEKLREQAQNIE